MSDDVSFTNMDSWRGGGNKYGLSYKEIVLQHINRCVINGSQEMHGGYWNEVGSNPVIRTYIQNTRDVYSNSVRILRALLRGYFDKDMKKSDGELQEEYDKALENFNKLENKTKEQKYEIMDWKVQWHMKLFEELVKLSKRLNYFDEQESEGEVV